MRPASFSGGSPTSLIKTSDDAHCPLGQYPNHSSRIQRLEIVTRISLNQVVSLVCAVVERVGSSNR